MAYRPAHLKIENKTGYTLHLKSLQVDCGKLESSPPGDVLAGTSGVWTAAGAGLKGPKGSATYALLKGRNSQDKSGNGDATAGSGAIELTFFWNHPVGSATSAYTVTSNPDGQVVYQVNPAKPVGHEQHITYIPMLAHAYEPIEHARWMKALPDETHLHAITMPGTHDTCARIGGPLAQCQTLSLSDQLNAGIRFIDIRCKDESGALRIYHGPMSQNLDFDSGVRDVCQAFLRDNPSECIVMLVKKEGGAGIAPRFWSALQGHESQWYLKDTMPTLREARGRIVLLRRFENGETAPLEGSGMDLTDWKDNDTFSINDNGINFRIQDQYNVPNLFKIPDKWNHAQSLFGEAAQDPSEAWFLNYTSGSSAFAHPIDVARGVNSRLLDYLFNTTQKFAGTVVMDFPEHPNHRQLVDTLIAMNQTD